jgi:ABC-2 type transport system permease protein
VEITPFEPIAEPIDAMLVVLPSRLLQDEMDNVFEVVKRGVPTLMLLDPVPATDMRLAPAAVMAARIDPFRRDEPIMTKNVGDIRKVLVSIGVNWPPTRIAWDSYSPHPDMAQMPREVVFVGKGNGNPEAFNPRHPATAGLQELVMLYPGYLLPLEGPGFTFEPLVRTGQASGSETYFQLFQPTPTGPLLNVGLPHNPEGKELVLAAHVRGAGGFAEKAGVRPVNVIAIADLDFISNRFFEMRSNSPVNASFDNLTFFLNCIDVLAGDESFIALRKRRLKHRTLERVEARTRTFIERRGREERQAANEAQQALDDARSRMKKTIEQIEQRSDLDAQAKQIMARNLEETENRRLQVLQTNIDQAKNAKIRASREKMEAEVRRIQGGIRTAAVLLPPVPVLCLGVAIFLRRQRRERQGAAAVRRLRGAA